jgi:hypothetical protein
MFEESPAIDSDRCDSLRACAERPFQQASNIAAGDGNLDRIAFSLVRDCEVSFMHIMQGLHDRALCNPLQRAGMMRRTLLRTFSFMAGPAFFPPNESTRIRDPHAAQREQRCTYAEHHVRVSQRAVPALAI